jgi:putative hydrolase of the HAD superfamily
MGVPADRKSRLSRPISLRSPHWRPGIRRLSCVIVLVAMHHVIVRELCEGVSAVIFDFFGTLTPSITAEVWLDHARKVATVMGVDGHALQCAFDESFPERAVGAMGDLSQTLHTLADRLGTQLTGKRLEAACQTRRELQRELFALRGDALSVLECLRMHGLKIGVLSDCSCELPETWPELPLATIVDVAVFSCIAGMRKPDPRLFRLAADELGVAPSRCLYVGDGGGRELSGARAAGMRSVLLAGDDWHINAVYDREQGWDGPRIRSLGALCR